MAVSPWASCTSNRGEGVVADSQGNNAGIVIGVTAGLGLLAAALFGGKSKPKTGLSGARPQPPKLRKSGCNCGR